MLKLNTIRQVCYISNHGYIQRPHLLHSRKETAVTYIWRRPVCSELGFILSALLFPVKASLWLPNVTWSYRPSSILACFLVLSNDFFSVLSELSSCCGVTTDSDLILQVCPSILSPFLPPLCITAVGTPSSVLWVALLQEQPLSQLSICEWFAPPLCCVLHPGKFVPKSTLCRWACVLLI